MTECPTPRRDNNDPLLISIDPSWPETLKTAMHRINKNLSQLRGVPFADGEYFQNDSSCGHERVRGDTSRQAIVGYEGDIWIAQKNLDKTTAPPSSPQWTKVPLRSSGRARVIWGTFMQTLGHSDESQRVKITSFMDGYNPADPPLLTATISGTWVEGDEIIFFHGLDDMATIVIDENVGTEDVASQIAEQWSNCFHNTIATADGDVVSIFGHPNSAYGDPIGIAASVTTADSGTVTMSEERGGQTVLVYNKESSLNGYAFYGQVDQTFKAIYDYDQGKYWIDWVEPYGITGDQLVIVGIETTETTIVYKIDKVSRIDGVAKEIIHGDDSEEDDVEDITFGVVEPEPC